MKLLIINGPNLNKLGEREPEIYGSKSLDQLMEEVAASFPAHTVEHYQSNLEGDIINKIQQATDHDGIILNAGGYTHTSVAIADAIAATPVPVIEVHISNVYKREEYRHVSLMASKCVGIITGFGVNSYILAGFYFISLYQKGKNQ